MKQHWVRLQLRFEAQKSQVRNAIASGGLNWQYIAILPDFLVTCSIVKLFASVSYSLHGARVKLFSPIVADVNATYATHEIKTNTTGISDETQSAQNETIRDTGET